MRTSATVIAAVRSLLAFVVLASCAQQSTTPPGVERDTAVVEETAPPTRGTRIAAFNVRRLFDATCDSGSCSTGDFEAVATPTQLESRLTKLAERIGTLDADVIMLEEIETAPLLDALAAKMPGFVTHVLGETGAPASVDVGVLSRLPTIEVRRHRDQTLKRPDGSTTTFAREFLEVHLDRNGARVIAFAAHFRSKNNDDPGRRYAEAVGARDIVSASAAEFPDALVVLGGDLNDVPGSEPLNALDEKLTRVSTGLPNDTIATYWFEGRGQPIDHLYVPSLSRYRAGTFVVARNEGERSFADSDHAAVRADFD